MNDVLNIYKPLGKTPLEMINQLKEKNDSYHNVPITYAGRLDPLAHGVLLLLAGDAIKEKENYLNLPKVYEFEVLLGFETDTYDVLGIQQKQYTKPQNNVNLFVNSFANTCLNMNQQAYPPFSSKTVQGKPLFVWAKEGKLSEIDIPKREITISQFEILGDIKMSAHDLEKRIMDNISKVHGDFRQNDILNQWEIFFTNNKEKTFQTLQLRINCSSGTYVRGIVHDLGNAIGCGAIALDILRTRVGDYHLEEAIRLE